MGLYIISIILSILLYILFKGSIFESETKDEEEKKGEKNDKIIKICKICGYIIYSEKQKPKIPPAKNCCRLCCESIQNCCNETFCFWLGLCGCDCSCFYDCCDCCECCDYFCCCFYDCCSNINNWCLDPSCYCSLCENCKYDPKDYNKKEEYFLYCYKAQRKCYWCNNCVTNEMQKKIFPYMIQYFVLQLTTIGFEKQYKKYKDLNTHRKTFIAIFISTFILYFYFTLSFTRVFLNDKKDNSTESLEKDKDKEKEKENDKKNIKEAVSKISNEILNGIYGILLFNGIFSLIISSFYLSNMSEDIKSFLFKDNINIIFIPILMNKFFYFTLNYYCVYTGEEEKKFDIISGSSLISIYILIWNLAMSLIKSSIPEENNDYDYYNILYIIQIVFSSIPSLVVVGFIIIGSAFASGLIACCEWGCQDCDECKEAFSLHKFFFCLCSFVFCCGGLWIRMNDINDYEYECCYGGNCCDFGNNFYCFNVSCYENAIICDCCCCNIRSCCFSDYCNENCNTCKICGTRGASDKK